MAALAALVLMGPKYGRRQAQIERQLEGRQRAVRLAQGPGAAAEPAESPTSASDGLLVPLRPLLWLVGALTLVAWLLHWQSRWRDSHSQPPPRWAAGPPADTPLGPEHSANKLPS